MKKEIKKVERWAQKVFPRRNEGYFIGAYVGSYIDELMLDMGLKTNRTGKFLMNIGGLFGQIDIKM